MKILQVEKSERKRRRRKKNKIIKKNRLTCFSNIIILKYDSCSFNCKIFGIFNQFLFNVLLVN